MEFVLSGCCGGVERVDGRWKDTHGDLEAPEHLRKTISYSQMLSGHYSSYGGNPWGHTK